eukprot:5925073-Prymnesium_polylepis.1
MFNTKAFDYDRRGGHLCRASAVSLSTTRQGGCRATLCPGGWGLTLCLVSLDSAWDVGRAP